LLLEEERKLGADLEFLAELEQIIISFDALMETEERLVALLKLNGNGGHERVTLNGLRKTRDIVSNARQKILAAYRKTVL
jgi:hypothetical protein